MTIAHEVMRRKAVPVASEAAPRSDPRYNL